MKNSSYQHTDIQNVSYFSFGKYQINNKRRSNKYISRRHFYSTPPFREKWMLHKLKKYHKIKYAKRRQIVSDILIIQYVKSEFSSENRMSRMLSRVSTATPRANIQFTYSWTIILQYIIYGSYPAAYRRHVVLCFATICFPYAKYVCTIISMSDVRKRSLKTVWASRVGKRTDLISPLWITKRFDSSEPIVRDGWPQKPGRLFNEVQYIIYKTT